VQLRADICLHFPTPVFGRRVSRDLRAAGPWQPVRCESGHVTRSADQSGGLGAVVLLTVALPTHLLNAQLTNPDLGARDVVSVGRFGQRC
jgi:hypothetical protein